MNNHFTSTISDVCKFTAYIFKSPYPAHPQALTYILLTVKLTDAYLNSTNSEASQSKHGYSLPWSNSGPTHKSSIAKSQAPLSKLCINPCRTHILGG